MVYSYFALAKKIWLWNEVLLLFNIKSWNYLIQPQVQIPSTPCLLFYNLFYWIVFKLWWYSLGSFCNTFLQKKTVNIRQDSNSIRKTTKEYHHDSGYWYLRFKNGLTLRLQFWKNPFTLSPYLSDAENQFFVKPLTSSSSDHI